MNRWDPMGLDWRWDGKRWKKLHGTPHVPKPAFSGDYVGQRFTRNDYTHEAQALILGKSPESAVAYVIQGGELYTADNLTLLAQGHLDLDQTSLALADEAELFEFFQHELEVHVGSDKSGSWRMLGREYGVGVDYAASEMAKTHLLLRGDPTAHGRDAAIGIGIGLGVRGAVWLGKKSLPVISQMLNRAQVATSRAMLAAKREARAAAYKLKQAMQPQLSAAGVGQVNMDDAVAGPRGRLKRTETQQKWDVLHREADDHHISTNKNRLSTAGGGPFTPEFEDMFEKAELTLEDEANIVKVFGHRGPHPEYNAAVFRHLSKKLKGIPAHTDQYRERLLNELYDIGTETQIPGTSWNRMVTGP